MNKPAQQFQRAGANYNDRAIIQQWVRDAMLAEIGSNQGQWLDIGCGPQVQQLGDHTLGIDIARFGQSDQVQACMQALPIANDSIHGIFSNMALQWCEQPLTALAEWRRVAKQDAKIACSVTCAGNFSELLSAYFRLGLPCPVQPTLPATAWLSLFDTEFTRIRHHVHQYPLHFDDITGLIHHIKETGANSPACDSGIRSRGAFQQLEAAMPKAADGSLRLTYKVLSIVAVNV